MNAHTPDGVADALYAYFNTIEQLVAENITDDDVEARLRAVKLRAAGRTSTPSGRSTRPHDRAAVPLSLYAEGAFRPAPLPSNLVVGEKTQQLMAQAQHMLGRLDEAAARMSNRTALVRMTQLREIESMRVSQGAAAAMKAIAYLEFPNSSPDLKLDETVVRYLRSVDEAAHDIGQAPVGRTLFQVATRLADDSTDSAGGRDLPWRSTDHWFGDSPKQAYLLALPPGPALREAAAQLMEWIDGTSDMPLIGKAALGAYQLYTLAPFEHTADLLHVYVVLELVKSGALRDQIIPLSGYIDRNRGYFQKLHRNVVETGEFDDWIQFFADGVIKQCGEQVDLVEQLEELRSTVALGARQRRATLDRLTDVLTANPIFTVKQVAKWCNITMKEARGLIKYAEERGMIEVAHLKREQEDELKEDTPLVELFTGMALAAARSA